MADSWEAAQAKVLARRDSKKFALTGMSTRSRYEYAMEITPSGGDEPFDTTMITPMMVDRWLPLNADDVVTVLYNPASKQVKWDRKEPSTSRKIVVAREQQEIKRHQDEQFDQALHHQPGSDRN